MDTNWLLGRLLPMPRMLQNAILCKEARQLLDHNLQREREVEQKEDLVVAPGLVATALAVTGAYTPKKRMNQNLRLGVLLGFVLSMLKHGASPVVTF